MLQKAIENWLTNTNERRYMMPFIQVLIAEGHTIKYVSKHGQMEQGKDIISIDEAGVVWAFQLKTGDVDLAEWRKIVGEIRELSELSVVHSSVPLGTPFRAVLVANGRIADTVRHQIVQINNDNVAKDRKAAHIETVEIDELIRRFLAAQGDFIPTQPVDAERFLRFYLANGSDFFDKKEFQSFILGSCLLDTVETESGARHALTSSIIMTAYSLKNFQDKKNHWAIAEAWISLLGYIYRFSQSKNLDKDLVESIGNMILDEVMEELKQLEEEVLARPIDRAFLEGDLFGDGALIFRSRGTMVLGALCCYHDYLMKEGKEDTTNEKILELVVIYLPSLWFWGESAFPFFYWIGRFLESHQEAIHAVKLWFVLTDVVTQGCSLENDIWIPSPYVPVSDVIRKLYGLVSPSEEIEGEQKNSGSYILKPLIEILTRRDGREALRVRWRVISHIFLQEFRPTDAGDIFLWRAEHGENDSRPPEQTQSWANLVEMSVNQADTSSLAYDWAERFLPLFILVVPHRATSEMMKKFESGRIF